MIDTTLQDKSRMLIDSKIAERRKILESEVCKMGTIGASSGAMEQYFQLICTEFRTRCTIAWQGIVTAHKVMGSIHSDSIADTLKVELYNYIREACLELTFKLHNIDRYSKMPTQYSLDDVQAQIVDKYDEEVNAYVGSLSARQPGATRK